MPIVRVSASPTITAGTFAVGDAVGTQLTFSTGENAGSIIGCRVLDNGRQSVPLELWLFRESIAPNPANDWDNDPFAPSDAQIANSAGVIRVAEWFHTPENSVGQSEELPFSFAGLTSGLLYGWFVCRGEPTYAAGDLAVELQIRQGVSPIDRRRMYYYRKRNYPPLTKITDIKAAENYHTIHLQVEFEPPANVPASTPHVTGSYLRKGRWVKFHPALLDAKGDDILYTVLFGLDEDTTYPVKLEFSRTNDATGALIESRTYQRVFKTRKSPVSGTGSAIYLSPTGSDSNSGTTSGSPKRTPAAAAGALGTGGHLVFLYGTNGVYESADYGLLDGKATGGSSTSIILDSAARTIDDFYKDWTVTIISGTGSGQTRTINGYTGSTRTATVSANFTTAPDSTSVYQVTKTDLQFGASAWQVNSIDGTETAYKTIRAETDGQLVTITGRRPLKNLTWTKHATRVYYADYSAYMKTTASEESPKAAPQFIRRVSTGNILYIYGGLNSDSGPNVGINSGTLTVEGFCMDWGANRIYLRLAPGDTDTAPTDGMYECSSRDQTLRFVDSDFWIVKDIRMEMFGAIQDTGTSYVSQIENVYRYRIHNCDDFVTRNCVFVCCNLRFTAGGLRNTLEDATVTMNDPLGKILASPWTSTLWSYGHETVNATFAIVANDVGDSLVIRRSTLEKADSAVVAGDSAATNTRYCDIYDNDIEWMSDDAIEFDTAPANSTGAGINLAMWFNRFLYVNNCLSLSPFNPGPVWFVANFGEECGLFYHFKVGQASTGDGSTNSIGHKLFYHNTLFTSFSSTGGADCFHFNEGAGNIRLVNNILRGSGSKYISDGPNTDYQAPNTFLRNAFYLPSPSADPWQYKGSTTDYATEGDYQSATSADEFTVTGNISNVNPFPSGLGSAIDAALQNIATAIDGISDIAGDANSDPIVAPLDLGYFPKWADE